MHPPVKQEAGTACTLRAQTNNQRCDKPIIRNPLQNSISENFVRSAAFFKRHLLLRTIISKRTLSHDCEHRKVE